jgi:hypothetical protein
VVWTHQCPICKATFDKPEVDLEPLPEHEYAGGICPGSGMLGTTKGSR